MINLIDYILDLFRDESQRTGVRRQSRPGPGGRRVVDRQFCPAAVGGRDGHPELGVRRQR